MSAPDPAPPSPPDPAPASVSPVEPPAYPARRGLGPGFWLLLALGLVCVVAGYLVARLGPGLFPPAPPPAAPAPAAVPVASVDARLADIQARINAREDVQATRDQIVVASAEVDALTRRLDQVERRQQGALDAAAAALAVAGLDQAAQGSGGFAAQLSAVEPFLPASPDVRRLRALAGAGAPSRAALGAEFPEVARRAVAATRTGNPGDGVLSRMAQALSAVVTVRRVDRMGGQGVDAVLARAEAQLNDGDLEGAIAEMDALPANARTAAAPWRARAARRVEVDARLASIRTAALQQLARRQENLAQEPLL